MEINQVVTVISSLGTLVAAIALLLTFRQFRRLEDTVRGTTYQVTSDQAIGILRLLLEYPELDYPALRTENGDAARRRQAVFDRIVANYLDNAWGQIQLGLTNKELTQAYQNLIAQVVVERPDVANHMIKTNFSESLRSFVKRVVSNKDALVEESKEG